MREPPSGSRAGIAPRQVPESFVRAEVACFPLIGRTAFFSGLLELSPSLEAADEPGRLTRELWRECEKKLSGHASGRSLDRLVALRDFFWFRGAGRVGPAISMRRYLQELARLHLESSPGTTAVKQPAEANAFDALTHYRWLSFALPEDLLMAAAGAESPPARVDLEAPMLIRRLLDQGVAEIHQHIGAGMDFPALWASLLAAIGDPGNSPGAFQSPDLPFGDGETYLRWLLAAAIARCVLAELMLRSPGGGSLRGFLDELWARWPGKRLRALARALEAFGMGWEEELPVLEELRSLYLEMHPLALEIASEPPRTLREFWASCDPVAVRAGLEEPNAGEQWLVYRGLQRLEGQEELQGERDPLFARLFWQAIRVRCVCYRTVVQRPMTAGLQWFIRFFGRLKPLRQPLRRVRSEVAYGLAGGGEAIAALEVRVGPSDSPFEAAAELRELTESWSRVLGDWPRTASGQEPEFGVVVNLCKSRDPSFRWAGGYPPAFGRLTHAEPDPRDLLRPGGRYSDYFVEQSTLVGATADLLRGVPLALLLVRGLDVATDELGVPTWVFVPLYRFVEQQARLAAVSPAALGAPPLRLTAHVGEDFRHLMEGLRHVFEVVRYLLPRAGGRLGHATALGIAPRIWAESVGSVMMPAEERLWDLVFEWRLYSDYRIPDEMTASVPAGRAESVETQIRQLADQVFGRSLEPCVLAEAHHLLHQLWSTELSPSGGAEAPGLDAFARALDRVDRSQVRSFAQVRRVVREHREDGEVFRRGQQLVDICLTESEIAALQAVQDAMRRCVAARGIVVEVNPSSNLLIGNLLDLRNHPTLRLFPPEPLDGEPPAVPIAVGSDDPLIFSTHLLREYTLLYEAALGAGFPERCVHDWLARIQKTSMDARFTVPWRPSASWMAGKLCRALDDYLQRPLLREPRAARGGRRRRGCSKS